MEEFIRENWIYLLLIIFLISVSFFEYGCRRCRTDDKKNKGKGNKRAQ